jgi:hypothetical protein
VLKLLRGAEPAASRAFTIGAVNAHQTLRASSTLIVVLYLCVPDGSSCSHRGAGSGRATWCPVRHPG